MAEGIYSTQQTPASKLLVELGILRDDRQDAPQRLMEVFSEHIVTDPSRAGFSCGLVQLKNLRNQRLQPSCDVVTKPADRERRQYERFPQVFEVHARSLLSGPGQKASARPKEFDGRINNLSNGGVCILSSCPLPPATFLLFNFPVSDAPVSIPTLMQVRWTVKRGQKSPSCISGLQFVV